MKSSPLAAAAMLITAVAAASLAYAADPASKAASKPAAVDADMQAVLDAHASLKPKPLDKLSAAEARKQPTPADAVGVVLKAKGMSTDPTVLVPGVKHVDRTITGAAGEIPARIYTPDGAGPFPVIVYYHGGGWVIADKNVYDGGARGLSKLANAVVVSIDYRQAPEHKFPAAWDDSLAAYKCPPGDGQRPLRCRASRWR